MGLMGARVGEFASAIGAGASEASLVRELQAGSEDAFNQLIAQYNGPVFALVRRSLQDPSEAADVTQDVFIKVFRSVSGFHGDSSLRTWIYRIALHEASNRRRWWSRHRKAEVAIDAEPEDGFDHNAPSLHEMLADHRDGPLDCALQSELRERVEAALRAVPESYRSVVLLREMEGMQYEEIAEVLALNVGTVKSRLMRGRAALRDALLTQTGKAATR